MAAGQRPGAQPLSEHIAELRIRLLYVIATLISGCVAGYILHERIFRTLRHPLHAQLYYTTPTGGFNAIIKISVLFGVVVTIPVMIYQLGKFLSPAFKKKYHANRILLASTFLAALGVLFAYYLSLPAALHFLANIDSHDFQALITVNEYLNFVFGYLAAFALLFQLPLLLMFINRIKPQKPGSLMRAQRWVILISFILAAVLTPTPDPINQTIMALPIILLFQFSVALIWLSNRRARRHQAIEEQLVDTGGPDEPEAPADEEPRSFGKPVLTAYNSAAYGNGASMPGTLPQASASTINDIYNTTP